MIGLQPHSQQEIALIPPVLTSLLALICTCLALKLRQCLQQTAQLTKELASANFRLDLAQQSLSILESELERKTFSVPVKSAQSVKKTEEKKILAHYSESSAASKEDEIQNYLEDSGAMIIQEDQVGRWVNCERKLSILEQGLKELHHLLNSPRKKRELPRAEIFKTAVFLVDKMLESCS